MKKQFMLEDLECANCAQKMEDAIRKMEAALCELVIQGVETNVDDQLAIVRSRAFRTGEYDTGFLDLKQ